VQSSPQRKEGDQVLFESGHSLERGEKAALDLGPISHGTGEPRDRIHFSGCLSLRGRCGEVETEMHTLLGDVVLGSEGSGAAGGED
jgi:hypothetical protein